MSSTTNRHATCVTPQPRSLPPIGLGHASCRLVLAGWLTGALLLAAAAPARGTTRRGIKSAAAATRAHPSRTPRTPRSHKPGKGSRALGLVLGRFSGRSYSHASPAPVPARTQFLLNEAAGTLEVRFATRGPAVSGRLATMGRGTLTQTFDITSDRMQDGDRRIFCAASSPGTWSSNNSCMAKYLGVAEARVGGARGELTLQADGGVRWFHTAHVTSRATGRLRTVHLTEAFCGRARRR